MEGTKGRPGVCFQETPGNWPLPPIPPSILTEGPDPRPDLLAGGRVLQVALLTVQATSQVDAFVAFPGLVEGRTHAL